MHELEQRRFELHASTSEYHQRIATARDAIHATAERYERPCLHVSGGKDSLVLWHLASQQCGLDWPVYHFDNGLLNVPGVTGLVRETATAWDSDLYVRTSEAANDERLVLEEGHGYNGYWGHYASLVKQNGWTCRVLGIRGQESPQRRDRFSSGTVPTDKQGQYLTVAPIHQLKTADVWAYMVDHDITYHEIYDKQGELYDGIDAPENRLVTLYDSEFDSLGSREIAQFLYPGETNSLKDIEQGGQ